MQPILAQTLPNTHRSLRMAWVLNKVTQKHMANTKPVLKSTLSSHTFSTKRTLVIITSFLPRCFKGARVTAGIMASSAWHSHHRCPPSPHSFHHFPPMLPPSINFPCSLSEAIAVRALTQEERNINVTRNEMQSSCFFTMSVWKNLCTEMENMFSRAQADRYELVGSWNCWKGHTGELKLLIWM